MNELVAAVSSLQRLAAYNLARRVLASAPAQLASGAVAALGPWRSLLLPLPTPLELLSQCAPLPGCCSRMRCVCIRPQPLCWLLPLSDVYPPRNGCCCVTRRP